MVSLTLVLQTIPIAYLLPIMPVWHIGQLLHTKINGSLFILTLSVIFHVAAVKFLHD